MTPIQAMCGWFLMSPKARQDFADMLVREQVVTQDVATTLLDWPMQDIWNPQRWEQ